MDASSASPAQPAPEEREADEPGDEKRREGGRAREEPEEEDGSSPGSVSAEDTAMEHGAGERDGGREEERARRGPEEQRARPAARGERALEDGPLDAAVEIALLAQALARGVERKLDAGREILLLPLAGDRLAPPCDADVTASVDFGFS